MQGGFVEAASPAPSCLQLAAAALELTCSPQVRGHPQSFVRRCALVACSQVRLQPPEQLQDIARAGMAMSAVGACPWRCAVPLLSAGCAWHEHTACVLLVCSCPYGVTSTGARLHLRCPQAHVGRRLCRACRRLRWLAPCCRPARGAQQMLRCWCSWRLCVAGPLSWDAATQTRSAARWLRCGEAGTGARPAHGNNLSLSIAAGALLSGPHL